MRPDKFPAEVLVADEAADFLNGVGTAEHELNSGRSEADVVAGDRVSPQAFSDTIVRRHLHFGKE